MKIKNFSFALLLSSAFIGVMATSKIIQNQKAQSLSQKTTLKENTKQAFVQSTTTINVEADTYLNGPSGTSNYSTSSDLVVKQTNATDNTYNRLAMLKFNLGDIDPNKGRIVKAELKFYLRQTDALNSTTKKQNFDDTPYIIGYNKDDSWDETMVTWNNYASYAQSAGEIARVLGKNIPYTKTGTTAWTVAAGTEVTWDITNTLRKDYQKDNAHLISLTLTSTSVSANMGTYFYSKENGNSAYIPKLVITQDSDIAFTLPEDTEMTVFEKIMSNISNILYDEAGNYNTISSNAQNYTNSISGTGTWSDLTYTGDVPTIHLDRLKTMALAYTNSQSSLYQNNDLYNAIVSGLQKWYNANPDHSNWFYDQIAYPQRIGETLILMRNGYLKIPTLLELNILTRMKSQGGAPDQSGSQGTGANKMNIAMHWIYRGCLAEDKVVVDKGVQQVFLPLALTTGEGLQQDYSYLQHGQQLYIGGYGWDIVNVATRVALYTVETTYAQGNADLDNLGIFLRQAYLRVIRGQNFMFNAFGRGIARENGSSQSGFGTLLERMKVIEPAYTNIYSQAIARLKNLQPASYGVDAQLTHFYRSDYTLQTRPEYTFELRTVSKRTLRNENGNGENMKGYFLADGATSIALTGTEYINIYPTWDWSMVPGTTSRQGTMVTPAQWGTAGNTDFVGGVTDSLRGVSVYDLDNNSTKAKKSWFFFDNEIVCLGSGISTSAGTQEVNTTLNQCLLQSDVITSSGGAVQNYSGNTTSLDFNNNLDWAIQGDVGYVLPNGGNIGLTAQSQSGNWNVINTSVASKVETKDVFKLWIKHGVSPSNASYAYLVVPNKSDAIAMQNYVSKNDISILQNTTNIQAVRHKSLNLHSFVFLQDNQTYSNDSISVNTDKACILMIQPLPGGKLKLNVADPTKKLSSVTVSIKWTGEDTPVQTTVNLPSTTEFAGKSVVTYLRPIKVLPLNLISFNGKREINNVKLTWKSTNESNVDRFEIWRNTAYSKPILAGTVKATNLAGTNQYFFNDKATVADDLYYQLRICDKDGKTHKSDIIVVKESLNGTINIYPNPAKDIIHINGVQNQSVEIFNSLGKLVLDKYISNEGTISLGNLPNGIYFLRVGKLNKKIVIKK